MAQQLSLHPTLSLVAAIRIMWRLLMCHRQGSPCCLASRSLQPANLRKTQCNIRMSFFARCQDTIMLSTHICNLRQGEWDFSWESSGYSTYTAAAPDLPQHPWTREHSISRIQLAQTTSISYYTTIVYNSTVIARASDSKHNRLLKV